MFDKERLYKDLSSILDNKPAHKEPKISVGLGSAVVLIVIFVLLSGWVMADLYRAVHSVETIALIRQ